MKWNAWYALVGYVIGLALDDILKALGLHWLAWPVVGLLALFALAGSYIVRRRKRS